MKMEHQPEHKFVDEIFMPNLADIHNEFSRGIKEIIINKAIKENLWFMQRVISIDGNYKRIYSPKEMNEEFRNSYYIDSIELSHIKFFDISDYLQKQILHRGEDDLVTTTLKNRIKESDEWVKTRSGTDVFLSGKDKERVDKYINDKLNYMKKDD